MLEELISKKDLLEEMQISYGQLYRWKRKKLIPEEWFIKKSVSTGQETFFPREEIIERINKILQLKDDISLDELAAKFTYNIKDITIKRDYLINREIVAQNIIERFETIVQSEGVYNQTKLFALFIYNNLLQNGLLSLDEVNEITLAVIKGYNELQNHEYALVVKRKLGVCFYYVIYGQTDIIKDENAISLTIISVKEILEKIANLK